VGGPTDPRARGRNALVGLVHVADGVHRCGIVVYSRQRQRREGDCGALGWQAVVDPANAESRRRRFEPSQRCVVHLSYRLHRRGNRRVRELRSAAGGALERLNMVDSSNPPTALSAALTGVSCTSRSFCVAVGFVFVTGGTSTFAERWNGRRWSIQQIPNPKPNPGLGAPIENSLAGVSCTSSRFCIAVGVAGAPEISRGSTLAERWNGSTWSIQQTQNPSPNPDPDDALNAVSCTSRSACTAVGSANVGQGFFEPEAQRWNARRWSTQLPTPNPAANAVQLSLSVNGVSCTSRRACTSVGSFSNDFRSLTLAQHWNGLSWSDQRTPRLGLVLNGVSCTSATVCIAVGSGPRGPLAERFTGPNRKRRSGLG